jgi:DNA (cytosine-5)-methyltransferase 1
MLGQLGYGFAYRVLDAQYVRVDGYGRAVPQRRNRVFVVGCLGDWRRAAAVLLERESLRGDLAPRREAGARVAATLTRGADSSGKGGYAGRRQEDDYNIVAGALSSSQGGADDNSAQAHHLVAFGGGNTTGAIDVATCLTHHGMRQDFDSETFIAHAFDARQSDVIQYGDMTGPLDTDGSSIAVAVGPWVRRLMPIECERLQGFPDDYTRVPFRGKPAADGPRYKAIGNSWSANCPRWIGRRIAIVDRIAAQQRLAA